MEKAVGVFIPGAGQESTGATSIDLGAKGVVEIQLISSGENWGRGPTKDIHSSLHAIVDSPAWRLVKALDTLVKEDGHTPAIEGWFENVKPLTARQKELIAEGVSKSNEAEIKSQLGVKHWIDDEDFLTASYRLAQQPTINIQGLVSGYTGPGGKTVLPGPRGGQARPSAGARHDQGRDGSKLKAHLAKHGFGDIIVNVSGGYGPTETDENSLLVKSQIATLKKAGIEYSLNPRHGGFMAGRDLHRPAAEAARGRLRHRHGRRSACAERMVPDRQQEPEEDRRPRRVDDVLRRLSLRACGDGEGQPLVRLGAQTSVGSGRPLRQRSAIARACLPALLVLLAQLAAALLVGFGLAGGRGIDAGRGDLHRQA